MEKKMMTKTFMVAEIVNIVSWYNKIRSEEATKHKFDCLPFKIQYALRNNIKAMAEEIKTFDEMKNEFAQQLQQEFFTEEKTDKVPGENGADDQLKLKDEYVDEYRTKCAELDKKLYEVAIEKTDVSLSCYSLEAIIENLDEETIEKSGIDIDDFSMLEFMNITEEA